ncbi:HAD family hydrolase [Parafannyhessea umbonata]|uniref:HAD-hyrolase-like n=1 Tax=Parafannyhessea umbonata TaxID=604330 RepID=A0A1H9NGY1_9ACTN|nr:HAD family hydrolase [Parafannyhessea umbonata]SER35244.1 HAD-hyrolase-like [Parafannyhessea umbonata]
MHELSGDASRSRFTELLSDVDVVSFDVFGTLLQRACSSPNFVFDLAFARWSGLPLECDGAFARARAAADDTSVHGRPMTLDEIYGSLPILTPSERDELKRLEVDCERRVLFARPDVRAMYDEAVACGKRIVVTSDMYLSSEVLSGLLEENGYEETECIFVSCEWGCGKSDGRLLASVARELSVEPDRVLHVGDSLAADVRGARLSGVKPFYVGDRVQSKLLGKLGHHHARVDLSDRLDPLLSHRCSGESPEFEVGYRTLGPLMLGFCQWLKEELAAKGMGEAFFLARDAKFILECYRLLYPSESSTTRYLRVSRRTMNSSALEGCSTLEDLRDAVGFPRVMTAYAFCSAVGIKYDEDFVPALDPSDSISADEAFDRDAFFADPRVVRASQGILRAVRGNAAQMRRLLEEYVRQEGLSDGCALVDVGWHGSAQRALERVVRGRLRGRYIGTTKTEDLDSEGYVYNDLSRDGESLMAGYWGLFESFFASGDGITSGYVVSGSRIVPLMESCELAPESLQLIRSVQDGARRFLSDAVRLGLAEVGPMDSEDALAGVHRCGTRPTVDLVRLFGDLEFLDFGETKHIVERRGRADYVAHPSLLKRDFFGSTWRIGFMKSMIVLPFDYGPAYTTLRHLFHSTGR